ncbi:biotin transporter BioY [Deferribacterales bacterium RsTz2092]|nr:biotin transporter BioY [Deferribacterales bacterium]
MKYNKIATIGVLTAFITVSGFIRIPFPVMPLTLAVFSVFFVPMLVGAQLSVAAFALYIALGLVGVPVFATGGGPAYILQPSFGFLLGYMFSSIPNGLISARGKPSFWRNILGGSVALVVLYVIGIVGLWLSLNYAQGKAVTLLNSFKSVLMFIPFDVLKLVVAATIASKLRPALAKLAE